jgi:hypothetical protein
VGICKEHICGVVENITDTLRGNENTEKLGAKVIRNQILLVDRLIKTPYVAQGLKTTKP